MNLADRVRAARRWLPLVLLGAAGVSIAAGTVYLAYGGYQVGAYNYGTHVWQTAGLLAWEDIVGKIRGAQGPKLARFGFMGLGALLMAALTYLRYWFAWWPLSPVGLAVASAFTIRAIFFMLFVTWLVKVTVLRLGGIRLYERSKPFFYGLVLGHMCGMGFLLILDVLLWPTGPGTG